MLPTKGYFQDIECPFYNTTCGRPYCHFRHKRKLNENVEDNVQDTSKTFVPTYKPTPKSELANIRNNRSHIPISYVPDLSFKRERTVRPVIIDKPTYKPTPLSILSSATKPESSLPEYHEHQETIKDIQENIASNVYDPRKSEIDFEDLSNEFEIIDTIINDSQEEPEESINDNLIKLENDIEIEQSRLNLLQSEIDTDEVCQDEKNISEQLIKTEIFSDEDEHSEQVTKGKEPVEVFIKKENESIAIKEEKLNKNPDKSKSDKSQIDHQSNSKSNERKEDHRNGKDSKSSHKSRDKSKSTEKSKQGSSKSNSSKENDLKQIENSSKSHKCNEGEKHRKEGKKSRGDENSKDKPRDKHRSESKDTSTSPDKNSSSRTGKHSKDKPRDKHRSKSKSKDRSKSPRGNKNNKESSKKKSESSCTSDSGTSDSSPDRHRKDKKSGSFRSKKQKSRDKSHTASRKNDKKSKIKSRSRSSSKNREKHKSKHKSKHRSRSRTRSRSSHKSEDKKQSKQKEDKEKSKKKEVKEKNKQKNKDKDRAKSSSKEKSGYSTSRKSREDNIEKITKLPPKSNKSDTSDDSDQDNLEQDMVMYSEELVPSDVDLELDDEDETMRECYKIFNEYKPAPIRHQPKIEEVEKKDLNEDESKVCPGKKRMAHAGAENLSNYSKLPNIVPPKPILLPGQMLKNRYKIAKMAQASNEQENIMNEVKNITQQPVKRPATTLLEAARLHKIKRLEQQKAAEREKSHVNLVDDILKGVHRPNPSQVKVLPKKIAAVPNVALIEKAKQRISLVKQQASQNIKTIAQTQKSGRVAHVPEYSLSDIPDVLQAEKSKLPVNVRTRFLTMIAEECSKLYSLKDDAYKRALNEEFTCYEKCKVLATYKNSAMLAVSRLRKEIQERENKGLGLLLSGEAVTCKKETDFEGKTFYNHVKKWILTEEELDIHGYPRESGERGKAIINNRIEIDYSIVDENQRKCSRCSRIYQVDDDGWALFDEECMYHPLKKRTIRGEQVFLCCKSNDESGCVTSDTHVFDGLQKHLLEGYQTTLPPESDDDVRSLQVYALDCEMCYTTKGLELTRVTVVDTESKTVYESFVKPINPIIDYNTRFSGITKDQMDRTSTNILQVQANILHLCNSETILVGHSLESDMKALKIVHGTIIDTSVLFPHKMGLPHKRALRALASEYLKKIIQNDVSGHDSAEDAIACMELIKWKLKEELKIRTK